MPVRQTALLVLVVLPGITVVMVCGYYALQDWAVLKASYSHYEKLAMAGADLRALFVAEARQNVFRINLFAEGVWALLGAILAAIGIHGLCCLSAKK
jgi:hypothetical protein